MNPKSLPLIPFCCFVCGCRQPQTLHIDQRLVGTWRREGSSGERLILAADATYLETVWGTPYGGSGSWSADKGQISFSKKVDGSKVSGAVTYRLLQETNQKVVLLLYGSESLALYSIDKPDDEIKRYVKDKR